MNVLVVRNEQSAEARDASLLLQTYLASQGIECSSAVSQRLPGLVPLGEDGRPRHPLLGGPDGATPFDLAVALGGDGTILRTARAVYGTSAPVLGINFGHLGFLANSSDKGVVPLVAAALSGDVHHEPRTALVVDVECEGDGEGGCPEGAEVLGGDGADGAAASGGGRPAGERSFCVLNEAALARGASGRIVDFTVRVAGDRLASLRGDGVVVSTATGSTAYALSAGGPLIGPGFRGLAVVPLAVHTLKSRPVVIGHSDVVEIELDQKALAGEVPLFLDGEPLDVGRPVRRIVARAADRPIDLLRYGDVSFYDRLSQVFF